MKLINCIAGVIMSRTAIVFSDKVVDFWGEFKELEQVCNRVSLSDYDECILKSQGTKYRYLTEVIFEGNEVAQNVFDLTIAQMLYPSFGVLLRRYTGYSTCVENGCRLAGDKEPEFTTMLTAYSLLSALFETDDMIPFFQEEFFCDNRILAFLEGKDRDFLPRGVQLYLQEEPPGEQYLKVPFEQQMIKAIDNQIDFGVISKEENADSFIVPVCAAKAGRNMIVLQADFIEKNALGKSITGLIREAKLYQAGIFLAGLNGQVLKRLGIDGNSLIMEFRSRARSHHVPIGIGVTYELDQEVKLAQYQNMELFFVDRPGRTERICQWNLLLGKHGLVGVDWTQSALATDIGTKYALTIAQQQQLIGYLEKNRSDMPTRKEVGSFCRKLLGLSVPFGTLEEPDEQITIEHLIIPAQQKELLNRICNHIWYEEKVYTEWGMEEKYRYGKGVPVLFAGPPGTGKTMAAHVISNMLDIPLYRVDLSQVTDKYIGETEKHLSRIFDCAEENHMLLFFDEADALFGKRSEVKEAKDRYANTEISYILQRIEQFDGIAILATNLRENIDTAFIRRMKYVIDFQRPDKSMREEIWRKGFSNDVPLGEIDYDFLARQFELTGGNIKNIILTATFLAAGRNEPIEMSHILQAIQNEYYKYSKKMTLEDFGEYGYLFLER